ncbi:MAG: hypothetical protein JWO94_902, partial [Verrucomicrobiaceae bacterium]|nr:hypothetical protein [Verrucomicrobiaceae bacterium]
MKSRCLVFCMVILVAAGIAGAHPSDISQMRVRLAHDQV